MKKQTTYWVTGIAAAVIIIFLIVSGMSSGRKNNNLPSGSANEQLQENTSSTGSNGISSETLFESSGAHTGAGNADSQNSSVAKADKALAEYLEEQEDIMEDMIDDMEIEPSGNASLDFLRGMIPHHEAAIEMSEEYLEYGGNHPDLRQIAEDIISSQKDEIELMENLIYTIKTSGKKDETKEQKYLNAYSQMMSSEQHMSHGVSSAQDVEQAFAEGMIMHHQMAIDMSKAILDYTDDDEVRRLAEDIIEIQGEEIQAMEEILAVYH